MIQSPRRLTLSTGEVWWSGIPSAISTPFLRDKRVRHIINLGVPLTPVLVNEIKKGAGLKSYNFFDVQDSPDQNMIPHVYRCMEIIDDAHKEGEVVLVHCFAGRNRSGTVIANVVADDLVKNLGMDKKEAMVAAIDFIKKTTKGAALTNDSFVRQLQTLSS